MMAHGIGDVLGEGPNSIKMAQQQHHQRKPTGVMGSRRIFPATFKLKVLDSYRNDVDCRGNQRATARKYGIHRRQIQKWLQCEENLRSSCADTSIVNNKTPVSSPSQVSISPSSPAPALNLSLARLHGDESPPARHPVHPPLLGFNDYPEQNPTQQQHPQDIDNDQKYYIINHGNYESTGGFSYTRLPYQSSIVSLHHAGTSSPSIKSEPASPDSVAPSSPAMSTTTTTTTTSTAANGIYHTDLQTATGMDAVHFSTHVQDSEKPSGHLERVAIVVKEELLEEEVITEERGTSNYEGSERSIAASPQVTSSSSSVTSSCSDSEIDPLDYTSSLQNPGSDLSRRRSFSLKFKLNVLNAFYGDLGVAGNQRATARKYGINRRQVQKWLGQENELRGEIALRGGGDMRQRLGPLQESPRESPVDLRTASSPVYCCDSSSHRYQYYPTVPLEVCQHSCCNCSLPTRTCYPETGSFQCYSPRDNMDLIVEPVERKRSHYNMSCYYTMLPSPKRICIETVQLEEEKPLCLVMPKIAESEIVSSTVPSPSTNENAILFKPYLDVPVIKRTTDDSSLNNNGILNNNNNNNNCHGICNLNENKIDNRNYAVELKVKVPFTWHAQPLTGYHDNIINEEVHSAFARYPGHC